MKKFLITMAPFVILLFLFMWFSWGLEGALAFFGILLFIGVLTLGLAKWIEFVDKHIKD